MKRINLYFITLVLIPIFVVSIIYNSIDKNELTTKEKEIKQETEKVITTKKTEEKNIVIKINKNGLKNGGIIGLGYVLILYLLSSISEATFALTKYSVLTIIIYILAGMIGGIIGVNLIKGN